MSFPKSLDRLLRRSKVYLIVVLSQLQHFLDDGLIELAVLTIVLQGQALHPALLMQVQQHLKNNKSYFSCSITKINNSKSLCDNKCILEPFAPARFSCN